MKIVMRGLVIAAAALTFAEMGRGDVVYDTTTASPAYATTGPTSLASRTSSTTINNSSAILFTAGATAAVWKLDSLKINLSNTDVNSVSPNLSIQLFSYSGTSTTGTSLATKTYTSPTNIGAKSSTLFTIDLTTPTTGNFNNIIAGNQYLLDIVVTGWTFNLQQNGSNLFTYAEGTQTAVSPWSLQTGTVNNNNGSTPMTFSALLLPGATPFAIGLEASVVTPVPEPGTLLLGCLATLSGGTGVWWKRRKKKVEEHAVINDQPADV